MDGLNFAATEYGTVMRSEPVRKPYSPSAAQLAQQDRIRRASRGYAALTPAQVSMWAGYASGTTHLDKQGKPFAPSAYQSYSALSALWYAANGTARAAPATPPTASLEVPADFSMTATASAGKVTLTAASSPGDDNVVEIGLQRLANANRRPAANGYRVATYATIPDGGGSVVVTVAPGIYVARYRVVSRSTGQRAGYVTTAVAGVALALEDGGTSETAAPERRKRAA